MLLLSRHLQTVALVDRNRPLSRRVRLYFGLPERGALAYRMSDAGLGQADLVLCLLNLGDHLRWYVERLIGRPILVLPSVNPWWPVNGAARISRPRIVWVNPNPKLHRASGTDARLRFRACFRAGRTVEEARVRGATTRDIRVAVRRRLIVIEEAA